ncbi:signal peptidase I [Enterococcus sp. DIV0724b]|uniref:signal peptidase I n=1 Tax=Enterococcus sp. DIV0724b TaxID=2774694 RepID=UPI003D2FB7C7
MKQANTTSKKRSSKKKQKEKNQQLKRKQPIKKKSDFAETAKINRISSKKKRPAQSKQVQFKKKKTKRTLKKRKKQRHQFYKEIGVSFFLMLALFFILQELFFSMPSVNGYGMTTTLNDGDRIFVSKRSRIKRFDLVYLKQPDTKQIMVRRVIGLPEEEIVYENDQLLIDKRSVVERFLKNEISEASKEKRLLTEDFTLAALTGVRTLPKDCYFVLGDNRHYAADSREFGWVEKKDILGVVKARIVPFHHMTQF